MSIGIRGAVGIGPQTGIEGPQSHLLVLRNDGPLILWADKVALSVCEAVKHVEDSGKDRLSAYLVDDAFGKIATLFVGSRHRSQL